MTIKEYLSDKTLTAVEIADSLIFNLVCDQLIMGVEEDTSGVPSGTPLTRRYDFVLTDTTLSCNGISLDINTTNVL